MELFRSGRAGRPPGPQSGRRYDGNEVDTFRTATAGALTPAPEPGAAGRTLWDSAGALGTSYGDARYRAVQTLCPDLAPTGITTASRLPPIRPVTVAVTRGPVTAEHVPVPAGRPWKPTGAHEAAARAILSHLANRQAATPGRHPLPDLDAALRELRQRAASRPRVHLAAVLPLHTRTAAPNPIPRAARRGTTVPTTPAARPQPAPVPPQSTVRPQPDLARRPQGRGR
ncbi:hypothetical protein GCM10010232_48880 [Streptomyces amakusaensis]|uniref:Uncharacterized protein n=1 Tax=Streptomyces amakusaensis TaxID=67271 RepID=A0ABW0ANN9_9ACTN